MYIRIWTAPWVLVDMILYAFSLYLKKDQDSKNLEKRGIIYGTKKWFS